MAHEKTRRSTLTAVWAGIAIGGNLIAAPAKFQVQALSLPELLMVGRAQFAWIGAAEIALACVILVAFLIKRQSPGLGLLAALAVCAVQQIGLQPLLETRSDLIIAGQAPGHSQLHLVFVAAEVLKVGLLFLSVSRP